MDTKHSTLWDRFEAHLDNERVTAKRKNKLWAMFILTQRGLKDLTTATREDIEAFLTRLNKDTFRKKDGSSYSGSSKSDEKKFLKQFYKWFRGNNEAYPPEVAWIKTRIGKDDLPEEKPTLSKEMVISFSNQFKKIEYRLLVLLLFDSGFRISEALSIKKKDLTFEDFEPGTKCFWVMCNESKTITRKVPIPLFTEDIQTFHNSAYFQGMSDDEPIFKMSHSDILNSFKRASVTLWGEFEGKPKKVITPHALRHSSATYYAREYDGNMNLIAERYGWSYSSKEMKTYIRRSGAYQKQGVKKVFDNEILLMKKQLIELTEKYHNLENAMKTSGGVIQIAQERKGSISRETLKEVLKEMIKSGEISL